MCLMCCFYSYYSRQVKEKHGNVYNSFILKGASRISTDPTAGLSYSSFIVKGSDRKQLVPRSEQLDCAAALRVFL